MQIVHYLFHIQDIALKSRAKFCVQLRMSLPSTPVSLLLSDFNVILTSCYLK